MTRRITRESTENGKSALSPAGTAAGLTGALGTKPSVSWNCT